MAHLRDITFKCDSYGCASTAIQQIYTFRNEPGGRYCKRHAARELKAFDRREKEYIQRCADLGERP